MKICVKTVTVLFMFFTTNSFADVKGELFLDTNYVAGSSIHDISRKNLRLHAVSLEKFVDLLEKDRILVSFDDDLLSELNIASAMNGLVSGDLRSTYEMAVKNSTDVNAVCLLLKQLTEIAPQLEHVASYVTVYQSGSVKRVWLGKLPIEDKECGIVFTSQADLFAGDIVLFNYGLVF